MKLYQQMQDDISASEKELLNVKKDLDAMTTTEEVLSERFKKEKSFKKIFTTYTSQLQLKPLSDQRYLDLYKIQSFPRQGVELHKTVMAYHFALNTMIEKSQKAHRLPFLLDAILKEDIDSTNLEAIFSFVGENLPDDTQAFISISEHVRDDIGNMSEEESKAIEKVKVDAVIDNYFPEGTSLLYIGDGQVERGFLSQPLDRHQELYQNTLNISAV